jgi:hypothetical protein
MEKEKMIKNIKDGFKLARKLRKQQKKIQEVMMAFSIEDKKIVMEYQRQPDKKEILDKLSDESRQKLEAVTKEILE